MVILFAKSGLILWSIGGYLSLLIWWLISMEFSHLILVSVDNSLNALTIMVVMRYAMVNIIYILWLGPLCHHSSYSLPYWEPYPDQECAQSKDDLFFSFYNNFITTQKLFQVSTIMSSASKYYWYSKFIFI